MEFADVQLPVGVPLEGSWRRDAVLRQLTGHDEVFLLEQGRKLTPAALTTAMLARCVCRLGSISPVPAETVRALSVGDREALLLHLRRLTLGEGMSCVLGCPACAEKLDLDLKVSELLLPPYPDGAEFCETSIRLGDTSYRVRFRLPNGGDQEQAALIAGAPEDAAQLILQRCVHHILDEGTGRPLDSVPPLLADRLGEVMAASDPQAEILLDLICPACGESFRSPFDVADYLYRELGRRESELYREIHLLALHYHWSESQILRLSRRKRSLYLGMLGEVRIQ
jgi:hypothetical protein